VQVHFGDNYQLQIIITRNGIRRHRYGGNSHFLVFFTGVDYSFHMLFKVLIIPFLFHLDTQDGLDS